MTDTVQYGLVVLYGLYSWYWEHSPLLRLWLDLAMSPVGVLLYESHPAQGGADDDAITHMNLYIRAARANEGCQVWRLSPW